MQRNIKHWNILAKKYTYEEDDHMMVGEPAVDYGSQITIPISIPAMGGYTREDLTRKLTDIAIKLVMYPNNPKPLNIEKEYSPRLQRLRSMSRDHITSQDILDDERLGYLLSK